MSTHKVVTVETLGRYMTKDEVDALPTPTLDASRLERAMEHVETAGPLGESRCFACGFDWPCDTSTAVTALLAGAAAHAQLRAAVEAYQRVAGESKPVLLGDDPDNAIGVAYHFTTAQDNDLIDAEAAMKAALASEPSALAERYRALLAMEERVKQWDFEPMPMEALSRPEIVYYILHGEATDAG